VRRAATTPPARAPAFFTNLRRVIMLVFVMWALLRACFENRRLESRLQAELRRDRLKAGLQTEFDLIRRFFSNTLSVDLSKNEIHKVSQILLSQPFLQPFRHERCPLGLHLRDLRTRDDHLNAEGLTNCDAAGRFVHDDASVAVPLLGFDDIGEVVRRNFAVGVQDIDQQLLLAAASSPCQIRPNGESVAAEAVAGLTTLLENSLAALVVAAQLEDGQKTPDHVVALVVRRGAEQLDGAL